MTQRPSPEAASAPAPASAPGADAASAERVSRYKEERRRQLSAQLGAAATAGPGPPPQRRFISRASSAASSAAASASSGDAGAGAAPRVRTTRASRLRSAAAASSDSSPNADPPLDGSCGNGAAAAALAGAAARTRRLGAAAAGAGATLPTRRSSAANGAAAERQAQSAQSDCGPRREKDKSAKRKSNLNRCLTAEAVAPAVHSDESSGGGSVRRRRRPVNGAGAAPAVASAVSSAPGAAPEPSTSAPRSRKSFDGSLELSRSAVHADTASLSGSPVGGSPRQQQPHLRLNGTTSTVVPISPVRSTASPSCTPRTVSPRTSSAGFVPVVNTRKPSSPLVTPSKSRLTESRYLSKKPDLKTGDTSQKIDILTALTKETLARLDRLNNASVSEEHTRQLTGESHLLRSNTSTLSNGHAQDHAEHNLKKSASAVVSVDSPSSFPCEEDPEHRVEIHERSKSPTKPASSILKKKSLEEPLGTVPSVPVVTAQPVSILKRKTSQDEAGSSVSTTPAPPVTFSPSVEDHVRNSRRQGILKKRASLDESEVMRRRSCSPDVNHSWARDSYEFRPILKNQRRSSMEELVRRTQSPELQPHSILKRKTSRDDDTEERTVTSPEPQGILKRKSNVSSSSSSGSGSPHVSISQTVIMNVAGISSTEFGTDASEVVRPILKKKSSSEDTTTADSSSADTPKPILKKKTSTDVDESEDRPKKPILKSSRRSSQEGRGSVSLDGTPRESPTRCLKLRSHSATASDSTSGSDGEAVRPILKQTNSRERSSSPRPRLSFCDDEDEDRLIGRSTASSGSDTTRPVSPVGEGAVLRRNRVLCSPVSLESERDNFVSKRRSWEPSCSVDDTDNLQLRNQPNPDEPRSLSVAERIVNLENLLSQPVRSSSTAAVKTGAVPKRQGLARSLRDKERFHTQPVTMDELEASALLASAHDFHRSIAGRSQQSRPNELMQINGDKVSSSTDESPSADTSVPDSLDDTLASTPSPATESDKHLQHTLSSSPIMEGRQNSRATEESDEKMVSEGASLTKSCSVSAMASLFARKQEDASRTVNSGVSRYRERRRLWAGESRVATQPVTQVEVEEAVRLNSQQSAQSDIPVVSSSTADDGNEDDPSKLSLSERIRLFNQKIKDEQTVKQPELGPRVTVKRPARFKTQPVTNEEVEIAQKKISNLAASLAKPPDPDTLGGLSIRAAREKIYEHAANILTKSSSASRLGQHPTSSRDVSPTTPQLGYAEGETKPRGILKHSDSQKTEAVSSEEVTEPESENEVKGILKSSSVSDRKIKTPEPDSSRHLKSVLKKDTSIEERPSFSSTENLSLSGDYPKSILKPNPKEWVDESSSSSSEDSGAASDSDSEVPAVTSSKRGMDLISILHDVEAQARQQRQQASRSNTGEKIKNIRNLSQEKENQVFTCEQISDSQKKESSQKTIADQQYSSHKLVTSTSLVEENSRSNAMKQINITNHRNNVNRKQVITEVNRVHKHINSEHRLSVDTNTSQTSDGETSSSGGREVKRIIRNEAIARRRQIAITRQNR